MCCGSFHFVRNIPWNLTYNHIFPTDFLGYKTPGNGTIFHLMMWIRYAISAVSTHNLRNESLSHAFRDRLFSY